MKTTEEKIKVMQAFLDGKTVIYSNEYRSGEMNIEDSGGEPLWNWELFSYGVKATPPVFDSWDDLQRRYKYVAMDKGRRVFAYSERPVALGGLEQWMRMGGDCIQLLNKTINLNGNSWDNSLVEAPN